MRKEISITELRGKLGELLDGVDHNGDRLIVKRANKPLAAIVPIETYEKMLQQRERSLFRPGANMEKSASSERRRSTSRY